MVDQWVDGLMNGYVISSQREGLRVWLWCYCYKLPALTSVNVAPVYGLVLKVELLLGTWWLFFKQRGVANHCQIKQSQERCSK